MTSIQELWNQIKNRKEINENECWLYTGNIHYSTGYGRIQFKGRRELVHRISCAIHHGLDVNDRYQFACHTCNNRKCFNPEHLYNGDNQSNQLDAIDDKCKRGHDLKQHGGIAWTRGNRYCKLCNNESNRIAYYAKKAAISSESEVRVTI